MKQKTSLTSLPPQRGIDMTSAMIKRHDDFPEAWMGLPWFALRVTPAAERLVADRLGALGIPTAVPLRIEMRRRSRVAKIKEAVTFPVLAGYIFVGLPSAGLWRRVLGLRYVAGVLGVDGVPSRVEVSGLRSFCRRAAAGAFSAPVHHQHMRTGREFKVGERVEIIATGTPLDGQVVEVAGLRGEVARVVMQMLGSSREVNVRVDRLVAA
jgi:transcription antitermination factor NusG